MNNYHTIEVSLERLKKQPSTNAETKKKGFKKQFRKALANRLGMKYADLKPLLPTGLNSTMIANYLAPEIIPFSHEEIRDICQELKLEIQEGVI